MPSIQEVILNALLSPQRQQNVAQDPSISNSLGNVLGSFGEGYGKVVSDMYSGPSRFIGNVGAGIGMAPSAPAPTSDAFQASQVPQQGSQVSRPVSDFVQAQGEQAKKNNERNAKFKNLIAKMGIPLAAAIAGTVSDDLLPAAAGLAGGYVEGTRRTEDQTREDEEKSGDYIIADEKGNELTRIKRKKGEDVYIAKEEADSFLEQWAAMNGMTVPESGTKSVESRLKEFETEALARKAGYKSGDEVIIKGVEGTLD